MSYVIGIDPGLNGAFAVLREDESCVSICSTPTREVIGARRTYRHVDPDTIVQELLSYDQDFRFAQIESVHSMPGQGVSACFQFGEGFGIWLGVLAALKIPRRLVTPQKWKKGLGLPKGADKDASLELARKCFPCMVPYLARKKDEGRAEALLIALWGIRDEI
jgi:crossover junction endodeoxyribonuclease RuvC